MPLTGSLNSLSASFYAILFTKNVYFGCFWRISDFSFFRQRVKLIIQLVGIILLFSRINQREKLGEKFFKYTLTNDILRDMMYFRKGGVVWIIN